MAMQQMQPRRNSRNRLYNAPAPRAGRNWACWLLVLVIFAGAFSQIFSLAMLMHQHKQIDAANAQVQYLKNQERNARQALLQYTSDDSIEKRAEALGMIVAESENCEIRRVPVYMAAAVSDTNAQTAFAGGDQ